MNEPVRRDEVKVGQVWQDWDVRFRTRSDRRFEVLEIVERAVVVKREFRRVTYAKVRWRDSGLETFIRTDRMKPVSNGYRLVTDA